MDRIANRWKLIDPEPEVKGILLSDRIELYVRNHNLLIDRSHFKQTNLKPASYSLTLGTKYYLNGKVYEISQKDGVLEVPPNSFVVATTNEKVILPHWCAARYGVRVSFVYRGILVGAGPQVDPGFEGYLGCPIHNLTDRALRLKVGEPFAWIDFTKTSRLGENPELNSDSSLMDAAELSDRDQNEGRTWVIPGIQGFECRLYETVRRTFEDSLPPGETISSSLKGLEDEIHSVEGDWERTKKAMGDEIGRLTRISQRINLAAVSGLVAFVVTVLLTIGLELWMPRNATLIKLEQRTEALERRLDGVQSPVVTPEKVADPIPAPATGSR